jgi:predicted O-methyltransferase YrrM
MLRKWPPSNWYKLKAPQGAFLLMNFDQIKQKAQTDKIPSMQEEGLFYCQHLILSQSLVSILEIGTGHGIWSITMALASPLVKITTIELNPKRVSIARENIAAMKLSDRITVIEGDALMADLKGAYDLILIDGPKSQNKTLFLKALPFLNPKGFILIDNLDFHGETISKETQSRDLKQLVRKIKDFKAWIQNQSDLSVKEVDAGDGLMLVSRKYQV